MRDEVEHGIDAGLGGLLDATCHLGLAHQVGLEHQTEALGVGVDEVEECLHGRPDALPVVGGRPQCLPHSRDQGVDVALQHRYVQLQLAREMLVQDGLAHAGALGDLVHAGGVVAAADEDLAGGREQLKTPRVPG